MANKRPFPNVWTTYLPKLMTGEDVCEWKSQFKTHHYPNSYPKVDTGFDLARWQLEHTDLLRQEFKALETRWASVTIEDQNYFKLGQEGKNAAILAGKPDIVAVTGTSGIIVDVKAANKSISHQIQVLIYMYALPKALSQFKEVTFEGSVVYKGKHISIPAAEVDDDFTLRLGNLIKRLGSDTPSIKIPSYRECSFCDFTKATCSEKIIAEPTMLGTGTDDF